MKLVYPKYNICIAFEENIVNSLIIEHPEARQDMLCDLWAQFSGGNGGWILSDNEKELAIAKSAEVVFNPFGIDMNNRKVLTKLYQEIQDVLSVSEAERIGELHTGFVRLLDQVSGQLPYPLCFALNLDLIGLLKLYNVELDQEDLCFAERLCTYIRNMHQLCRIKVFIFLNMKLYLSEEQVKELYKFCFYEKVFVLGIESAPIWKTDEERVIVLDKDLCLISY